jgi:hypothetical protein
MNKNNRWFSADWDCTFVDSGVEQKYSYVADLPINAQLILIQSSFDYCDLDSESHDCQRAIHLNKLIAEGDKI